PVFLLADRAMTIQALSADLMQLAAEFIWILEDSPEFIAGRIAGAVSRFRKHLLPPLMAAICEYNETHHEYSWAAPGHQGGVGFTKNPVGKKFYDFYGENLFRTDTGIERTSIGSLLDHSGAFAASEAFAAQTFGADRSFSVVAGTSGSNRTIMQICLAEGETAVCDRNCHKSIEQGLILTGAKPVYMLPTRNCYGIIGPVPPAEMTPQAIRAKIQSSPLYPDPDKKAAYGVLTNCTYDGICYNAVKAEILLEQSVRRIHFDEAWYGYARFHPVYRNHYAMRGNPAEHRGATIFATHSTHKLLNALSQASYIHIRQGDDPISFARFNQAYMMHATTSPLYAICASNDIASAMMNDSGESLTEEVIAEAVDFRQALARLHRDFSRRGTWFFRPWNNDRITDPRSGKTWHFADAPRELLIRNQHCWKLTPGDRWHAFSDLPEEWVMLDPIKVSILGPGMDETGKMQNHGVPAALVSNYIYYEGIVPTRTTDFQLMFLFSMGITKGKWGTPLNA
ncbi:MAG: arginine decarboxylase, partial [Lentisphaeria bacterium]|nr:arginine decarboxylase [Lentisphaeria bacterium]